MNQPDCSLDALARAAAAQQLEISPQGLDQRFNETTTTFLKQVIEQAIGIAIQAEQPVKWAIPGNEWVKLMLFIYDKVLS